MNTPDQIKTYRTQFFEKTITVNAHDRFEAAQLIREKITTQENAIWINKYDANFAEEIIVDVVKRIEVNEAGCWTSCGEKPTFEKEKSINRRNALIAFFCFLGGGVMMLVWPPIGMMIVFISSCYLLMYFLKMS